MPLVSVITPAYNAARTLDRCHQSVNAQTFGDWEHIIVDDGSSDGTSEILRTISDKDSRVRALSLGRNGGAGVARNFGIAAAAGRFIAFIDADDEWLPSKLDAQIAFMQANRIELSYGAYQIGDGATSNIIATFQPPPTLSYADLLGGCPIGCLTATYDRANLGTQYMPDVKRGQDWGLWLSLARQTEKIAAYPGVHAVYYRNAGSISSSKFRKFLDVWQIYRKNEGLTIPQACWFMCSHLTYLAGRRRSFMKPVGAP